MKLNVKRAGKDTFRVAGLSRTASRFKVHVELGGITGVVAPIIGKQPDDLWVWTMDGDVHSFVRLLGSLYENGPIWTMELTSPVWNK